jgi:hypothetical protein
MKASSAKPTTVNTSFDLATDTQVLEFQAGRVTAATKVTSAAPSRLVVDARAAAVGRPSASDVGRDRSLM